MIPDKTRALIDKLISLTKSGKMFWTKTSRNTEYTVSFSAGAITTDEWSDDSDDYADFVIYNNDGVKIEILRYTKSEAPGWYEQIDALYKIVQRKYLKVDETIDGIFNEIESHTNKVV